MFTQIAYKLCMLAHINGSAQKPLSHRYHGQSTFCNFTQLAAFGSMHGMLLGAMSRRVKKSFAMHFRRSIAGKHKNMEMLEKTGNVHLTPGGDETGWQGVVGASARTGGLTLQKGR